MKFNSSLTRICACFGLLILVLASGVRGEGPATRPAGAQPYLLGLVPRIRSGAAKLNLSEDQKDKVNSILDAAAQDAKTLTDEVQTLSQQERYEKIRPFLSKLRTDLAGAMDADQFKALSQNIPVLRDQGGAGPTTRGDTAARPGQRLEAVKAALAKLDLSDDQKQKIADLLADLQNKVQQIRQSADGGDVQSKLQQLREDMRAKLQDILTPDQMQQLRDLMLQQPGGGGRPRGSASTRSSDDSSATADLTPADSRPMLPEPGSEAPDFAAVMLGGNTVHLSAWKGHVVVLEFGSLSCPIFRDQVPRMEKLRNEVGMRAAFLLIYTREAFPVGPENLQRNADDGLSVPQATDLVGRKATAQRARELLNITLPMAVDSMSDQIANAYGAMPNGAVVIGKDGKIVAREQWTNPDSLRRAIDRANGYAGG
jgi:thiol-disulfide isomerase/thioredoxin/predicted  nucleic acid-binding Zn-ribbon protein